MAGIGVISNPRSGANRRNPRLARRLAYILGEKGELGQPGDLGDLALLAERFKQRGIDVLCINGGDGTVHKVLTAFYNAYGDTPLPMIALLRGGTMNTVAHGLGIKGVPEDILGSVVSGYHADESFAIAERNLLVVRDGSERPRVGFLFGNGLVSNFLEVYYEGSDPSPWKAVKVLSRVILSVLLGGPLGQRLTAPVEVGVEVDGRRWDVDRFATLTAATVDDIGLGFRPFHAVLRHPDHLQVVGFACKLTAIIANLWRIFLARPIPRADVVDQLGRRLVVRSAGPQGYMIDGDFYKGSQTVTVEVGPRVRFVTG